MAKYKRFYNQELQQILPIPEFCMLRGFDEGGRAFIQISFFPNAGARRSEMILLFSGDEVGRIEEFFSSPSEKILLNLKKK